MDLTTITAEDLKINDVFEAEAAVDADDTLMCTDWKRVIMIQPQSANRITVTTRTLARGYVSTQTLNIRELLIKLEGADPAL